MFCKNCGAEIAAHAAVCPKCGVPVVNGNGQNQTTAPLAKAPNSISGFVCSLLGCCVPFVGFILSIIGLILCTKGYKAVRINPNAYSGTGFLIAGFIFGVIGLIGSFGFLVYMIVAGAFLGGAAASFLPFL